MLLDRRQADAGSEGGAGHDTHEFGVSARRLRWYTRGVARRRKHWGWGFEDEQPSLAELREAAAGLVEHLGFGSLDVEEPAPLSLPPSEVAPPSAVFTADDHERAVHAHGSSYIDVVRAFRGAFPHVPDLVAFPEDERQLVEVLEWCAAEGLPVTPYGGGTSVVGGVDPVWRGGVSVDLSRMARVLEVDPVSRAARIQAGARGPVLEEQLAAHGLTLRFYPQSFEFSTLGGWIATRAGGHFATGPTHIDDLVESVRAVTAGGDVWESRRLPGSGAGPSPDRMLLGSEGTLAVISSAWVRVRPRPSQRRSRLGHVPVLGDGCERGPGDRAVRPAARQLPAGLGAPEARLTFAGDCRPAGAGVRGRGRGRRPRVRRVPVPRRACAGGGWRRWRRLAGRVPPCAVPARHVRGLGGALRDLRDRGDLGPPARSRLLRQCRRSRRPRRRRLRHLPAHARLSRRRGPVLHRPRSRAPGLRGGAVAGDQGRGGRRRARRAAARSPTTTRSGGTTGPGTTGSAPDPFARAMRAAKDELDPHGLLNPGVLWEST